MTGFEGRTQEWLGRLSAACLCLAVLGTHPCCGETLRMRGEEICLYPRPENCRWWVATDADAGCVGCRLECMDRPLIFRQDLEFFPAPARPGQQCLPPNGGKP